LSFGAKRRKLNFQLELLIRHAQVDDEKLLLQEEVFGDERLRATGREHLGNRGQDVSKNKE